jgi:hypothetical protein
MKAIITFDKEENVKDGDWNWHYGTAKVGETEHPFSLLEMADNVGGEQVGSSYEVTWVETTPENSEVIEKEIISKFEEGVEA